MNHIVNFSGGAGSYVAAKRVIERYGADSVTLVTADTMSEAPDWLGFVEAAVERLSAEHVMLRDGRDIWDLAEDMNMIPSSRFGFCTRVLKKELIDKWRKERFDPEDTTVHLGFDWTERHRLERAQKSMAPWSVDAPLCWEPVIDKDGCLMAIQADDLPYPEAYQLGLPHNNCLSYGCVKGGQAYWAQILKQLPEVYARSEDREERLRERLGDYSVMRKQFDGVLVAWPLKKHREAIEAKEGYDRADYGACSCFSEI